MSSSASELSWLEPARLAYEAGASDAEVMKIMKATAKQFEQRYAQNPEFRAFIDVGRMMSKAWWYEQARLNLTNKSFQSPLWLANMKNRFGWSDKAEDRAADVSLGNKSAEEIKAELLPLMRRAMKSLKKDGLTEADVLKQLSASEH